MSNTQAVALYSLLVLGILMIVISCRGPLRTHPQLPEEPKSGFGIAPADQSRQCAPGSHIHAVGADYVMDEGVMLGDGQCYDDVTEKAK